MEGRDPGLHSGDNATGGHQGGELDLLVISTGSDAGNERGVIRDKGEVGQWKWRMRVTL